MSVIVFVRFVLGLASGKGAVHILCVLIPHKVFYHSGCLGKRKVRTAFVNTIQGLERVHMAAKGMSIDGTAFFETSFAQLHLKSGGIWGQHTPPPLPTSKHKVCMMVLDKIHAALKEDTLGSKSARLQGTEGAEDITELQDRATRGPADTRTGSEHKAKSGGAETYRKSRTFHSFFPGPPSKSLARQECRRP